MISKLAAYASVVAVAFGVWNYFRDSKRKAKLDTLEAYRILQKDVLSKINSWLPSEIEEMMHDKKSEEYKELSGILAQIEAFCLGINERIYDFETFYKLAHGYFDSDRGILKPRLLPIIKSKLDYAKEDYFRNIHMVWEKMEKKSKKLVKG